MSVHILSISNTMLMKINYAFVNHGPIPSWFLSKMSKMVVFENGPLTVQKHEITGMVRVLKPRVEYMIYI